MNARILGVVYAILFLVALPANASFVYQYTGGYFESFNSTDGNNLYDSSMRLTVTMSLDSPLTPNMAWSQIAPISFSVSDGARTITETNNELSFFFFETDETGNLVYWGIHAKTAFPNPTLVGSTQSEFVVSYTEGDGFPFNTAITSQCLILAGTSCDSSPHYLTSHTSMAEHTSTTGIWTMSAVPIPSAVWLFGSGLLGLIGIGKRKKPA